MDRRDILKGLGALSALALGKQDITPDCVVIEVGKVQQFAIKFPDGAIVSINATVSDLTAEPTIDDIGAECLSTTDRDLMPMPRVNIGLQVVDHQYKRA